VAELSREFQQQIEEWRARDATADSTDGATVQSADTTLQPSTPVESDSATP